MTTAAQLEQNPAARPPCAQPTGSVKPGTADFLCQRGQGHPGVHEVMIGDPGARMTWGSTAAMDADRRAHGFDTDDLDDDPED